MVGKRRLTAEEQAALDVVAVMADEEIDTVDVPEITDWSRARRGLLFGRNRPRTTIRRREQKPG